ncbi:MAG: oligosaccharide flippase family protein [Actinomycetota bacterium]|nr:oligosaccharide flippase family protein [Actinomycetota bacterium]
MTSSRTRVRKVLEHDDARAAGTVAGRRPGGTDSATPDGAPAALSAAALRGLFGRDSIYAGLWVLQLGVAAIFTPVSTRLLGPSRFGLVAASVAVMQVLVAVAGMSLQTAIQRRYATSGGERDARRLIVLAMVVSILVFVVADVTGPAWASALGLGRYPLVVRYAVMWACLTAISNAALGLLRSRDQLVIFATVSLLQSVVAEGLSMLLVLVVRRSAAEWVLGELLAQAAAVCVAIRYVPPLALRWRDRRIAASALRYSLPLVPAALAVFVLQASDRLVVQHDLGSDAVARYAVAYNIGSIAIILLGVLNTAWMPRVFALADPSVRDAVLAQSRDALYALLIPVLVGLGLGAPLLLHAWAPQSYRPDGLLLVVALVAASSVAVAGASAQTRVLLAHARTAPVAAATMFAACLNLALNVAFVPVLGIEGSALATLLGYASLHVLLVLSSRRTCLRPTHRRLALKLVAAVALAFLAAVLPVNVPFLVIRAALGAGCAAVFVAMLMTLSGNSTPPPMRRISAWLTSTVRTASA